MDIGIELKSTKYNSNNTLSYEKYDYVTVSSSSVLDENRRLSDASRELPTPRCNVPPARALLSNRSSHLSSFSCDVNASPRALPSSRNVNRSTTLPVIDPGGRRVESLPCESRFCPDDTGAKMGSKRLCLRIVLRASLPARRNRALLTSPAGGSLAGSDLAGAWRV